MWHLQDRPEIEESNRTTSGVVEARTHADGPHGDKWDTSPDQTSLLRHQRGRRRQHICDHPKAQAGGGQIMDDVQSHEQRSLGRL